MKPIVRRLALAAVVAALTVPAVLASGFHVYEQGSKASGQAVAFIARADDASAAYYNPAAVTKLEGLNIDFGFSAVFLGDTTFTWQGQETAANPLYGVTTPPYASPTLVGTEYDMKDHTPTPAHLGITYKAPGSKLGFSFSLTNPFGLVTDWSNDPNFTGRFSAWKTDLRTFDLAANVAYDFGGGWSASLGLNYLYTDLRSFSRWVQVPVPLGSGGPIVRANLLSDLEGDGGEIGFNGAVHFRNDQWAFGATYRSKFDVEIDGDATFDFLGVTEGAGLPPEVVGGIAQNLAALFPAQGGKGELRLPATFGLGIAYVGLENWEFELDVSRIAWSHFDEIPLTFERGIGPTAQRVRAVEENWDDSTAFRFGTSYDINETNQIRAGVYVEDNPIPARTLRPSIPDGDRTGATLGYGLKFGKFGFDIYWLHIFIDDTTVRLADTNATPAAVPQAIPLVTTTNAEEIGRIGTYESAIDLVGITLSYKF